MRAAILRVIAVVIVYMTVPGYGNARLAPAAPATGFIAPPARAVYFGDYVFVGNQTVELRSDLDAARLGVRSLLPDDFTLEQAAAAQIEHVHPFLCTP